MQYLTDLECPFIHDAAFGTSKEVMDWLLHHAVDLAYGDHGNPQPMHLVVPHHCLSLYNLVTHVAIPL